MARVELRRVPNAVRNVTRLCSQSFFRPIVPSHVASMAERGACFSLNSGSRLGR